MSIIVVVSATFKFPLISTLFIFVCPDTLKDDYNVDAPVINKLLKLVLLNKLLIDNNVDVENVENVVVATKANGSINNSGTTTYVS